MFPFLSFIPHSLSIISFTLHSSPYQCLQESFISLNPSQYINLQTEGFLEQYLGEAAGCAVLAPGGEVPELYVQQLHQLGHGPHGGWHVARTQKTFGLLCQLSGHDCCCLARTELSAKQCDGAGSGEKSKISTDG